MAEDKSKTRELMIKLLYLISRNYHQHENSGIIEHLEKMQIKNQQHLRELNDKALKQLSQQLIEIFKEFMHYNPSTQATKHFAKFYQPLIHLLREIPNS